MNRIPFLILISAICCLVMAACAGQQSTSQPLPIPTNVAQEPTAEVEATENGDSTIETLNLYQGTDGNPWWNDAVFYEVFLRSFKDSDGDGIGDINGLIEQLDYLNDGDPDTNDDLGVTGLWLMPIMESPSYHGYDVVDYLSVNEAYGTEDDFRRLIEEAHKRGIRVVIDLVINHTGSGHPWFEESRDPDSELRDWYIWADENPGYLGPDGQKVWHRDGGDFYYGLFWDQMPDLNLENPEVTEAVYETASFWLEEMGVDGFRLDAIKHLVENGKLQENTAATHDWLSGFNDHYKEVDPNAFTVGEAWTSTHQVIEYTGDEVDIAFQFDLARDILNSSEVGLGNLYAKELIPIIEKFPMNQYATFITNHDQNRAMSELKGDIPSAKIAASILLTGPGVPFIYYGEEVGMEGKKPDEDIRRPMQWSGEETGAGFTDGVPWRAPHENYMDVNVSLQNSEADSLLSHYRSLIHLRNQLAPLRIGDWTQVKAKPNKILSFIRHTEDGQILVVINPSDDPLDDYVLDLESGPLTDDAAANLLFGGGTVSDPIINDAGGFTEYVPLPTLPAQSTFIIDLTP